MVYLAIKELSGLAQDVIMVTSSLTKDINAKADLIYRPNAIRALSKITDSSMLPGIERFLKQSIVDRNPCVASAALVSCLHLYSANKDLVKRWSNEVQEAITSKGASTQYHALGLMYQIRQHDRMAVIKMVQNFARGSLRSPHAICMLIRFAYKVMDEEGSRSMLEYIESFLRHKSDMVAFEAARAICNLKDVTVKELFPAVSVLQLMLVNHKPILRFAAIRTLNKVAMSHPQAVFPCNLDMENLITDSNRSIATFAITALLKTGNEASVDRLMKQITGFMHEISDEFKVIVVDAVRSLCLKFPSKQQLMVSFLSGILRDEGGYEFKRAIVDALFDIIYHVPDSTEFALSQLCEFIEDCEFTKIAVRILHLLGSQGPKTPTPSKYIRYIYNRVILENAIVRSAAVSALVQFAIHDDSIRERIRVLLDRCTDDSDDEVRDRAAFFLGILDDKPLCLKYLNDSTFSWAQLEANLERHLKAGSGPFDTTTMAVISKEQDLQEALISKQQHQQQIELPEPVPEPEPVRQLDAIPELAKLGVLFKSCKPIELTEAETEYVVHCIKHVFSHHFVFEFACKNTLNDSLLEKVSIAMALESSEDPDISTFIPEFLIPTRLVYNVESSIYVVYKRTGPTTAYFSNTLKFVVHDCDPNTGEADEVGYDDEYVVEDVEIVVGDYILPSYVPNFDAEWEKLPEECIETYSLTAVASIKAAVTTLLDLLSVQPIDHAPVKDKATTHSLKASGVFVGGSPVLVKARMAHDPSSGVTMELAVRSNDPNVSERVANAIS